MIKVLKDNTKQEFYTRCASCDSELSYAFSDVKLEEMPYSYASNRSIKCPVCNKETHAELKAKDDYVYNPIGQIKLVSPIDNACCCHK